MNGILIINDKLAEFAERIPGKGMHISYLDKASGLMELYGEALSIAEEGNTPENEVKLEELAERIKKIVG